MKKYYLLFFGCLISIAALSQTLTVSTSQLNFGIVSENNPDSLSLTIYNNIGKTVLVSDIKFFKIYGAPAFSASLSNFYINDGFSQTIWIKFSPSHNIYHNSELVIENDGHRGPVSVDLLGQGHYSKSYYNTTQNLAEEALKTEIKNVTGANYNSMGYNSGRDTMFMIIDNQKLIGQGASQNTLECVYTGRLAVGYIDRTDCQNNDQFNTEHTWPQSLFSSAEPMKSDLHHLFPTDDVANNTRANYPFGMVTNASWTNGGSKFDNNTNIFEPRNQHKGETARAMMYFVLRYQNYSNFMDSQEAVLKTWNKTFLPTSVEIKRNNDIKLYQQNLNPFVDYPQFADRINSISTLSTAPVDFRLQKFDSIIDYGIVGTGGFLYDYSFIIVNDGNQPLQLSNFVLSNTSLFNITSGGSNYTLPPGESFKTVITLTTGSSVSTVNETLTFNTNSPSSPTVQVPIKANIVVLDVAEINNTGIIVFPNPATDHINVSCTKQEDLKFTITNELGQPVQIEQSKNYNSYNINLQTITSGFYILSAVGDKGTVYKQKIIKQE